MRVRLWTVLTLAAVVGASVGAAGVIRRQVRQNEAQRLTTAAGSVTMFSSQLIGRIESTLAPLHAVAAVTGGDPGRLAEAAKPPMAEGVLGAVVLYGTGAHPMVTLGTPRLSATLTSDQQGRLAATADQGGL